MGYRFSMSDETGDDTPELETETDPRTHEVEGDEGMPGEVVDTDANMPGDQPIEDDPPSVSEMYGRD